MDYADLGTTGLWVSRIAFGCRGIGGDYGPVDEVEARSAIMCALDLGVTLFNTAPDYGAGRVDEMLGQVLPHNPSAAAIALQVDASLLEQGAGAVRGAVERSLTRLRRDAVDIVVLHSFSADMLDAGGLLEPFESLRAAGLARVLGMSVHYGEDGLAAIVSKRAGVLQFPHNLLTSSPGQMVFPVAAQRGLGLMAREALSYGLFTGAHPPGTVFPPDDIRSQMPRDFVEIRTRVAHNLDFLRAGGRRTLAQAALRFALDSPQINTVVVGARTRRQVEEDVAALDAPPLTVDEHRRIRETLFDMAHRHF